MVAYCPPYSKFCWTGIELCSLSFCASLPSPKSILAVKGTRGETLELQRHSKASFSFSTKRLWAAHCRKIQLKKGTVYHPSLPLLLVGEQEQSPECLQKPLLLNLVLHLLWHFHLPVPLTHPSRDCISALSYYCSESKHSLECWLLEIKILKEESILLTYDVLNWLVQASTAFLLCFVLIEAGHVLCIGHAVLCWSFLGMQH